MNIENIERIMTSDLWEDITHNSHYRNYFILDTQSVEDERPSGFLFVLLVFFNAEVSEEILKNFRDRGARISLCEGLDPYESCRFYGTVKMLRFS